MTGFRDLFLVFLLLENCQPWHGIVEYLTRNFSKIVSFDLSKESEFFCPLKRSRFVKFEMEKTTALYSFIPSVFIRPVLHIEIYRSFIHVIDSAIVCLGCTHPSLTQSTNVGEHGRAKTQTPSSTRILDVFIYDCQISLQCQLISSLRHQLTQSHICRFQV